MNKKVFFLLFPFVIWPGIVFFASAQTSLREVYKVAGKDSLALEIYFPDTNDKPKPAMIFFFGGGWNQGSIEQFRPHAEHFVQKGLITVLVDYRVRSRQQTSPFDALEDAKSAIRYLKLHAERLAIDTSKIIASGGSAGGHLAAATALISGFNGKEDPEISTQPAALVLFNPVIDNGPGGYGYERIGAHYKDFSPLHNLSEGAPPTLFFLGTNDQLIPVVTAQYYAMVMKKVGSYCELILYEGEGHGFFNVRNKEIYLQTLEETEAFLRKTGLMPQSN
ncbi:alpha/beta hydrolase [Cyclobacterium jeungdonense]|uniref:Alpha/beta hydrolase n=1 Tax=Cyclobacterium jeungdonense TaxID=708087 RepID=A0ABT8C3F2_9BACT|nr:alpha/beta hydrolase [Cyclobacterium jeungdonense]MDN3686298.1 alpha/beta hydrolase [Cyclobacterium jeungdonense]